jgi:hypothetical protein
MDTIVDLGVDRSLAEIDQLRRIPMDVLDPTRSALVVVHMVKGVAGKVDTPSTVFSGVGPRGQGSSRPSNGCWTFRKPRRRWSSPRSHTR